MDNRHPKVMLSNVVDELNYTELGKLENVATHSTYSRVLKHYGHFNEVV